MMKRTNNAGKIQIFFTACGILCVAALLYIAFSFPKYYCMYRDGKTLNQVNDMEITVDTYETAYSSIAEKIHAMARAVSLGHPLYAVKINEPGIKISKGELTNIINKEFTKLYKYNIVPCTLKFREKSMVVCERYTLYGTSDSNEFQGISCWKLVYNNSKRRITFYLDEEYHKIYYFKIQQKKREVDGFAQQIYSYFNISAVYDKTSKSMIYSFDIWLQGIMRYFDLQLYPDRGDVWSGTEAIFQGIVEFENTYQMEFREDFFLQKQKTYRWETGIPMEKMIQF